MILINGCTTMEVRSNGDLVGTLSRLSGETFSFIYSEEWLKHPKSFPIALNLPLQAEAFIDTEENPRLRWFFDALLPEEGQRRLLAKMVGVHVDDTWSLLEECGSETTGALSITTANHTPRGDELVPLTADELHERITESDSVFLPCGAPKLVAMAGAQAKTAVVAEQGFFFQPSGTLSSSHILKPDSRSPYYPNTAANEHFCMRLAAAVGIEVPLTSMHFVPESVLSVERFDRIRSPEGLRADHVIDGTQMLGLSSEHKYSMMNARTLRLCSELCYEPNQTAAWIFDWTVFNVLIGNSDAHLKNISFKVWWNGAALAPFYDLLSTAVYATPDNWPIGPHWPEVKLSMKIGSAERYDEIGREDLLDFAEELGKSRSSAAMRLDTMVLYVRSKAEPVAGALNLKPGERRLIRSILALPIGEMTRRLAPGGKGSQSWGNF